MERNFSASMSVYRPWGARDYMGRNPETFLPGWAAAGSMSGPETWSAGNGAGALFDGQSHVMGKVLTRCAFSGVEEKPMVFRGATGSWVCAIVGAAAWLIPRLNSRLIVLPARSHASTLTRPVNAAWGGMQYWSGCSGMGSSGRHARSPVW